jgi:hypothetical protein
MALNYAVYVSTPKLNELGTVEGLHIGGSVKFCPGTINRYNDGIIKAMAMVLTKKDGTSTTCPLSKKVSLTVKNALENGVTKRDVISAITKLNICESIKDGNTTICAPLGKGSEEEEEFTIESTSKSKMTFEELAAY